MKTDLPIGKNSSFRQVSVDRTCLAIWLNLGGHSVTDKIPPIFFSRTVYALSDCERSIPSTHFIYADLPMK